MIANMLIINIAKHIGIHLFIHQKLSAGKDAPLGPSCVRASAVTATSAVISWLPSNSNFQVGIRNKQNKTNI